MIPSVRPPEPGERYDPAAEAAFRLEVERAFGQMSGIDISELNGSLPWARLDMTGLPTSNPGGSGRLWNDGGTLKIT